MIFSYRRYLWIGGIYLLSAFFLCAFEMKNQSFFTYYTVLYNRTYFLVGYLPLFLIGLVPLLNQIAIDEIVIRYEHHFDLVWNLESGMLRYTAYITGVFLLINIMVLALLSDDFMFQYIGFLIQAFFCSWVGWLFIGNFFFLSFVFFRNTVGAYFFCLLFFILTVSLSYTVGPVGFFLNSFERMYLFFEKKFAANILFLMYDCLLSAGAIALISVFFKRRDWLSNEKEGK